jgi:diadenosine tetraphosphate (Ap4A) HIT family hydrolase
VGSACLVCRELDGGIDVPGGFLWDDGLVAAYHSPPVPDRNPAPYLGHLQVVTHRHVARLGDLSDEEGGAVGRAAARLASALTAAGGAEWVYSAVIGTGVPHFHLHLLPRYAGTPRGVAWHAVDEWDRGRHGGAAEIDELAERLRAAVESG